MSIITNHEQRQNRIRYDYIGGKKTGPFVLGSYVARRVWKAVDPEDTPDYAYRVRNGLRLPVNSYRLRKENVVMPQENGSTDTWLPTGDYSQYFGPNWQGWNDTTYFQPTTSQRNSMEATAKNKALLKIKDQQIHLTNFVGEWGQLMEMLIKSAERLTKAMRAVRKGDFATAARALGTGKAGKGVSASKSAASNWLELQYGWLPVINDVYGAALEVEKSIQALRDQTQPIISVVATQSLRDQDKFYPGVQLGGAVVTRRYIAKVRVKLSYRVTDEGLAFLGRIGLANPLSLAWELAPLSMVADWFIPIGNSLNALDATLGCVFVDGSCSYELRSTLDWWRSFDVVQYPHRYQLLGDTKKGRWFEYQRGKLSDFPSVSIPQWKNPISATHAANALALLTQVAYSGRK